MLTSIEICKRLQISRLYAIIDEFWLNSDSVFPVLFPCQFFRLSLSEKPTAEQVMVSDLVKTDFLRQEILQK